MRVVCALQQTPGFSPGALTLALSIARELGTTLDDLGAMSDTELGRILSWNATQSTSFRSHLSDPIDRHQKLVDRGIRVSTVLNDDLPVWTHRLNTTPWLFYRGDISILEREAIGFSGSRDATDACLKLTRTVAATAAEQGMTVISGGARGVDMAAHAAALESGGTTVVLLPQGIDTWWPPDPFANAGDRTLVLSADLPWTEWSTVSAMQRNRGIVDLAHIITIPQAGITGGSHSTGLYALGRKRNLWVADLGDDYQGNQLLLRRGAKPLPWRDDAPDFELMRESPEASPSQQSLF